MSVAHRIIGHRGAAGQAPENTLASFRTASRYGARWIEFDVRLSGCGRLAVMHDSELHRTTNGSGPVTAFPYETLAELDAGGWFSSCFSQEKVPSFECVLDLAAELGLGLHVEAKSDAGLGQATAAAVAETLHRHAWDGPLIVSSIELDVLEGFQRHLPDVERAAVFDVYRADWSDVAREYGCVAVHCDHVWLDDERLAEFSGEREGRTLRAFTVNDPARAEVLYAGGVDAVFTDFPGRLLAGTPTPGSGNATPTRQRPPAA